MATSGGRLLVPQAWRTIRLAFEKTTRVIRERLPQSAKQAQLELQPVYVRQSAARHPVHRVAAIRQSQSRWYSTRRALDATLRRFSSTARRAGQSARVNRAAFPSSRTAAAVGQLTSRTPFASSLRPNLTGGAIPRTAGGYGTGAGRVGGARFFSHTPAAPAEVVNNVSAAVRAFWLSGQRAQFSGSDNRTGAMHFKAVSRTQEKAGRQMQKTQFLAPGAFIDFKTSPVVTAISPLSGTSQNTLNDDGLLETLSVDFARALKDLAIITNDLKKLATVGDLALTQPESNIIRVRFPGCDAETIERLCDELGVQRGIVHEDPEFDAYHGADMALMFPFAPSGAPTEHDPIPQHIGTKGEQVIWQEMMSPEQSPSPGFSHASATSHDFEHVQVDANPWLSSPSGYSSLHGSSELDAAELFEVSPKKFQQPPSDFEGMQGIYRFLEECDRAKR